MLSPHSHKSLKICFWESNTLNSANIISSCVEKFVISWIKETYSQSFLHKGDF